MVHIVVVIPKPRN